MVQRQPEIAANTRSATSLHAFLTRLIWLCVGPLLVLAAYLAIERVRSVQQDRNLEAAGVVKGLAASIDQELNARIGALSMLAQSPLANDAARRSELYQEAQGFRQSFGSHVVLVDPHMQMIFTTRLPFGSALPALPRPKGRAAVPAALQSGRPAVGDVFIGPADQLLVALAVPVMREGEAKAVLLTTLEAISFQSHLDAFALPDGWHLALMDGSGEAIARNRGSAGFVPDVDAEGRFSATSAVSSWSAVLEIPRDVYRAPLVAAALTLTLAVLGATLAGVVGGMLASRRLGRAVASLANTPDAGQAAAISEIAQVRELLDDAAQRQADAEARLRFSLEAAHIGDWDLDLSTGVAQCALRLENCPSLVESSSAWTLDDFLSQVHADDRAEVSRSFEVARINGLDWRVEFRVGNAACERTAEPRWLRLHGRVREEAGKPARMLGIVSDITQQRLAEASRLNAQRLELENLQVREASRLKSQFLANMSHELRTPLNAVIGFSDLLYQGIVPVSSPDHHDFLGHIRDSGEHLLKLINDVLDLSKVEAGKFEFFAVSVGLAQLVSEVLEVVRVLAQQKRIELSMAIDPALGELVLDPSRMKQVLYNYLSNAIKFTPEGGRVAVRARPEGAARFRIEVEDSGIGISDANLSRLFTEFEQLDAGTSKQHAGTGLGLALSRRLVEAQGGEVGASSTLGKGSVFYLVMDRIAGGDASTGERRLLVLENDAQVQSQLARGLAAKGFAVDTASTQDQALRQVSARRYDALTLDLSLSERGGLEVLANIRREGLNREAPVVGVSISTDAGSAASFAVANVLSKPIRSAEIVAAMAQFQGTSARRSKVMVIDDDPMAIELMQATLSSIGLDVIGVLSSRRALEELEFHCPDALVLDLMMPEPDGFTVLAALRQNPVWRDLPVFVWTSMLLTREEYATLARSARSVMSKGGGALPVMLEALRHWQPMAPAASSADQS